MRVGLGNSRAYPRATLRPPSSRITMWWSSPSSPATVGTMTGGMNPAAGTCAVSIQVILPATVKQDMALAGCAWPHPDAPRTATAPNATSARRIITRRFIPNPFPGGCGRHGAGGVKNCGDNARKERKTAGSHDPAVFWSTCVLTSDGRRQDVGDPTGREPPKRPEPAAPAEAAAAD